MPTNYNFILIRNSVTTFIKCWWSHRYSKLKLRQSHPEFVNLITNIFFQPSRLHPFHHSLTLFFLYFILLSISFFFCSSFSTYFFIPPSFLPPIQHPFTVSLSPSVSSSILPPSSPSHSGLLPFLPAFHS